MICKTMPLKIFYAQKILNYAPKKCIKSLFIFIFNKLYNFKMSFTNCYNNFLSLIYFNLKEKMSHNNILSDNNI